MRAQDPLSELGLVARRPPAGGSVLAADAQEPRRAFRRRGRRSRRRSSASTGGASGRRRATSATRPRSAIRHRGAAARGSLSLATPRCLMRSSSAPGRTASPRRSCWPEAGRSVLVLEAAETVGGGIRTAELTLPGFRHDVCSAIHPLGSARRSFGRCRSRSTASSGSSPPAPLAHPFDDGTAARARALARGRPRTASAPTAPPMRRLMQPLVRSADDMLGEILGPLRVPRHPLALARFGLAAVLPATSVARRRFADQRARRSSRAWRRTRCCRSPAPPSAAFGLVLGLLGHHVGWPLRTRRARRRSPMRSSPYLRSLGGEIETRHGASIRSTSLPRAGAVLARRHAAAAARPRGPPAAGRATAAGSPASATGQASSSSTWRSTARSRGGRRPRRIRPQRRVVVPDAHRAGPPGDDQGIGWPGHASV